MKNQIYDKTVTVKTVRPFSVAAITQAAMIAALYVVLTFIANAFGLANYAVQIRFSEALTILPYFTPAAVTGCALPDIIFGSLATLIGAVFTYRLRAYKWMAPVPPIVANMIIVPFVLLYAYGIRPLWFSFLTVTAGEIISCGVLGMGLLFTLEKYKNRLFIH